MTVAMELAAALHHSAQRVEAPREGVEGEKYYAPRRPEPPLPRKRPAPLAVEKPLGADPRRLCDGDLDDSTRTFGEGPLHLLGAEVKTVRKHRAGVATDRAPTEAKAEKDEGGGRGLAADELVQELLRPHRRLVAGLG